MQITKKLIITLMGFICCMIIFIGADDKETTVSYNVTSEYIWQIHSGIDFGQDAGVNQTVSRTAKIGNDDIGVRVTKNVIPEEKSLIISIADNQAFTISNGTRALDYRVSKTEGGDALEAGSAVLSVLSGTNTGSQELYFELTTDSGSAEVAGHYSGLITYIAEITSPPVHITYDMGSSDYSPLTYTYEKGTTITLPDYGYTGMYSTGNTYEMIPLKDRNTDTTMFTLEGATVNIYYSMVDEWSDGINTYSANDTITLNSDITVYPTSIGSEYSHETHLVILDEDIFETAELSYSSMSNTLTDNYGHTFTSDKVYALSDSSELANKRMDMYNLDGGLGIFDELVICPETYTDGLYADFFVSLIFETFDTSTYLTDAVFPPLTIEVPYGTRAYYGTPIPDSYEDGVVKNGKVYSNYIANEDNAFQYYITKWTAPGDRPSYDEYNMVAYTGQPNIPESAIRKTYVSGSCSLGMAAANPFDDVYQIGWDGSHISTANRWASNSSGDILTHTTRIQLHRDKMDEQAVKYLLCNQPLDYDTNFIKYSSHNEFVPVLKPSPLAFDSQEITHNLDGAHDYEFFDGPYSTDSRFSIDPTITKISEKNSANVDTNWITVDTDSYYLVYFNPNTPVGTYTVTVKASSPADDSYEAKDVYATFIIHVINNN